MSQSSLSAGPGVPHTVDSIKDDQGAVSPAGPGAACDLRAIFNDGRQGFLDKLLVTSIESPPSFDGELG